MYVRHCPAMTLLLGLLVLSSESVLAKDAQPATQTAAGQTPTLAEIAKANDAAWEAIKSVDIEYVLTMKCVENGRTSQETQRPGHWSKAGNLERLRMYPNTVEFGCPKNATFGGHEESDDLLCDGKTMRRWWDYDAKNKNKGALTLQNQQHLSAYIRPGTPRTLATQRGISPELLRYLRFEYESPLALSEIIASWKVSLKKKQTTKAGETLWLIHAEYPPKKSDDKLAGSYMDIYVNANKGFLIQKVTFYENNAAFDAKNVPAGEYSTVEIEEFLDSGYGVSFPKQAKYHLIGVTEHPRSEAGCFYFVSFAATKLSVNSPLPADAFDFRFPENMIVNQTVSKNEPDRLLLWGPDNKPAKEFKNLEEFDKYVEKKNFEKLSQRVEKNRSSKKPADLVERGMYDLQTRKYDAAITEFSEAISLDPKLDGALFWRGLACLCCKRDSARVVNDLTKCLHRESEPGDADSAVCRYLRGLAYASQKDGLDKASADMEEVLRLEPDDEQCLAGAYLVRSITQARKGFLAVALENATKAIEVDSAESNADAYAVRCYVYEKRGEHDKATADRETSKRLRATASNSNNLEAVFAVALHHCVLRLLPALE